eukprot:TRINITY_DN23826_c0_g1_i1.p1 TRINITY_DN23826_c0_g1~~TRINITY_DN23826_c0_g1_i1.p1  ORF type:complete len:613 (+),score=-125.33 TRINITY_DN23826_c0_g1_i1:59-1897(+)
MCGIIGAVAQRNVAEILVEGLKRLEYRGYDSAGMVVITPDLRDFSALHTTEKVAAIEDKTHTTPLPGHIGIAHTRWATHGKPSEKNAHPHFSHDLIALVHNGIIENHAVLHTFLVSKGYTFQSDTDTEVIGHLLHYYYTQDNITPVEALRKIIQKLTGAYALGVLFKDHPEHLFAVRHGSPLVLGVGIGENFIASDPLALLPVTQQYVHLEEGDIATLTTQQWTIENAGAPVKRLLHVANTEHVAHEKGDFDHFMLKEIFEQPKAIQKTTELLYTENGLHPDAFGSQASALFSQVERIRIVACGTSYHAGLVAQHWIEQWATLPCQVEIASENRYREEVVEPNTLFIALSQSGETADTLAALRISKKKGYLASLALCNTPESAMVREADFSFITQAGPEIGVAATKTFTTQLTALLLLALLLAQRKYPHKKAEIAKNLLPIKQLPYWAQKMLELENTMQSLALDFRETKDALFLGRNILYPIALEGALKLKEISYIHAEAYPAGELKHGPLALIEEGLPIIMLSSSHLMAEKVAADIQTLAARSAHICLLHADSLHFSDYSNQCKIALPSVPEIIAPIVYTIPLQLLAYYVAVIRGKNVDQPRHLAKSVTVE